MTKDDIIMALYQHINIDILAEAKRNGTLLAYYSSIAEKIVKPDVPQGRRDGVRIGNL